MRPGTELASAVSSSLAFQEEKCASETKGTPALLAREVGLVAAHVHLVGRVGLIIWLWRHVRGEHDVLQLVCMVQLLHRVGVGNVQAWLEHQC